MGAAAALPIVGGFIGALGAKSQANDQANAAEYNANINRTEADQALQQGAEQERQQRVFSNFQIGQERADFGASGVNSGGSVLDVLGESARNAEMDALQIKHGAEVKSWALQSGAQLDDMQASSAKNAGNWAAASAIFGGTSGSVKAGLFH